MKADRLKHSLTAPLHKKNKGDAGVGKEQLEHLREADAALRHVFESSATDKAKFPHNFTFKAMERISAEQARRQRRSRIAGYAAVSVVSVAAIVLFLLSLDFSGFVLPDFSAYGKMFSSEIFSADGSVVLSIAFCFVFFVVLDKVLSRYFYGKS
ncbi:MAG: hypothetical protein LUD00_06955 [Prevotellaceae bacterium]|nr:hypothetical protein [Prevotellaceae bacterium]